MLTVVRIGYPIGIGWGIIAPPIMLAAAKQFLLRHHALLVRVIGLYALRYGTRVGYRGDSGYFFIRRGLKEVRIGSSHAAYVADVVREFDLYFGAVSAKSIEGLDVCDFSRPGTHHLPFLGIDFMFTSLPEGVETCQAYFDVLKVEPGQVVIDAGAYCGLTAFLFARAVGPTGQVVAVEADPTNLQCLESNMTRLEVANAKSVHAALWKEAGTLKFASEGSLGSAVADLSTRGESTIDVRATTLSELALELSLARVDHVKMDIEGAEYDVLMSSQDFIAKYRPNFVVEVHRDRDGVVNTGILTRFFATLGYEVKRIKQGENEAFPLIHCAPR